MHTHTHTHTHTPHLLLTIWWRMTRSSPPSQYPLRQTHSHRSQCQHYIHTEGRGRVEKARVVRCRAKWHLVEVHESHFNVMRRCKISKNSSLRSLTPETLQPHSSHSMLPRWFTTVVNLSVRMCVCKGNTLLHRRRPETQCCNSFVRQMSSSSYC